MAENELKDMEVGELIRRLQQFDPKLIVKVACYEEGDCDLIGIEVHNHILHLYPHQ